MRQRSLLRDNLTAASTEQLYVGIQYFVLYRNDTENLSIDLIRSQHQMLNACYNQVNLGLSKVPSSGHYSFADVIGNPHVTFLPSDYKAVEEDMIIRVACSQSFSGITPVLNFLEASGHPKVSGKLNAIIAPLDSILGEAQVSGNACTVLSGSVGGELLPGQLTPFRLGLSLVHEAGHCMGLSHIFDSGCVQVHSDIPVQSNPNFEFVLANGTGTNCNRMRDCKYYRNGDNSVLTAGVPPPYSCWTCLADSQCPVCDTEPYEQGCNFLDYATDDNMVMFSKQQALAIRETLVSASNGVELKTSDGGAVPIADAANISAAVNSQGTIPPAGDTSMKSSKLWTPTLISVVAVCGAISAAAIALFIWWFVRIRRVA